MSKFLQTLLEYEPENHLKTLEYFLDITSNEIFFDDVFLYRLYNWKIKELADNSGEKVSEALLAMILYEVIWRILQKGGKPKDESGVFQPIINSYEKNFINQQLAMEIVQFQIQNPNYGHDWMGIWFYPTDLTMQLVKELKDKQV